MDVKLIAVLIGVVFGAIGYWVSTFWMQPIVRYRSIISKVHEDFILYAQVVNASDLNEDMQKLHRERILENRKSSARLSASFLELPKWYKLFLHLKGFNPMNAAKNLIGYSNTVDYEKSSDLQKLVRMDLGLPPES